MSSLLFPPVTVRWAKHRTSVCENHFSGGHETCGGREKIFGTWMKFQSVAFQMKATELYFPVVLFIMLCKVVLTFESVEKILKCDYSNESTEQYFPVVLFIMLYKVVLTLSLENVNIQMKASD